jgi:alpha-galactosidase
MSSRLKIAVLGVGSLSLTPILLHDALLIHKLDNIEIALSDTDESTLFLMADLGRRMAKKSGVDAKISAHTDQAPALEGATYIVCAAAPQRHPRFAADYKIIQTLAPDHLITEFGGVAGIAYSLRQIRLIQSICADIQRLAAPDPLLLNLSNPLPRVCQAARDQGVTTVGFCAASLRAYPLIWNILHQENSNYPFDLPRSLLDISMAGLNHLSFVLDLWDHDTGEDLYPQLKDSIQAGRTAAQPVTAQLFLETNYLATAGDDRIRDFLTPTPQTIPCPPPTDPADDKSHQQLLASLTQAALHDAPWDALLAHRAWERPIDFIAARSFDRPLAVFTSLNLINQNQLPQLPREVFVETPATVDRTGVHPATFNLPDSLLPLLRRTAQLNDTIVRAARWSSLDLLHEAVELDPTIQNKTTARAALDQCLKSHSDLLPPYT